MKEKIETKKLNRRSRGTVTTPASDREGTEENDETEEAKEDEIMKFVGMVKHN